MLKATISALFLSAAISFLHAEEAGLPIKVDPTWTAKDSNPSSKTFGQKLSVKNFTGTNSLWLITFDCDC